MSADVRICFFGDSFVNGTCDEVYHGWVGRVSERLRAHGVDLTAYNLGIRRDTSTDILMRWRQEAERRLISSVDGRIVFSFGVNDCVKESGSVRVPVSTTRMNAERIITGASAWRPTAVIGPPAVSTQDQDGINLRIADVNQGLRELCLVRDIPFLDIYAQLIDCPQWQQEMVAGDGVHPGGAGYERMARLIWLWPLWKTWFPNVL